MRLLIITIVGIIAIGWWGFLFNHLEVGSIKVYPNPRYTIGTLRTPDVDNICSNPTRVYRNVPLAKKKLVYEEYGVSYPQPIGKYEVDHFFPLGIGGSNDIKNLGLQPKDPRPGFREKDVVEAHVRTLLCTNQITQSEAVEMIKNWKKEYGELKYYNVGSTAFDPEGEP